MSAPFVDAAGNPDLTTFVAYLQRIGAEQMRAEMQTWEADPTDLLTFGDVARQCQHKEHAVILYAYGLESLKKNPAAISEDTNVSGANYFLGKTLLELRRPEEAISPLSTATTMNAGDAAAWQMRGYANVLSGRLQDGLDCFGRAASLEGKDEGQSGEFFEQVRQNIAMTRQEMARRQSQADPIALLDAILPGSGKDVAALFEQGSRAASERRFDVAVERYRASIARLKEIETAAQVSGRGDARTQHALAAQLAGAHASYGQCCLELDGTRVNRAAHAFARAIALGHVDEGVKKNLLWCMQTATALMQAAVCRSPAMPAVEAARYVRYHNEGYNLLKTPDPPGTPGRNWEGAVAMYREALRLAPNNAATQHGLGLALEGMKEDEAAIEAWVEVDRLDPTFNFEMRTYYDDSLMDQVEATQRAADSSAKPAREAGGGLWRRLFGG